MIAILSLLVTILMVRPTELLSRHSFCLSGSGPECNLCRGSDLYLDKGQCKRCPELGVGVARLIGILSGLAVGAGCLEVFFHPAAGKIAAVRTARRAVAWLSSYAQISGAQAKLKVIKFELEREECAPARCMLPRCICGCSVKRALFLNEVSFPKLSPSLLWQILFSFYGIATRVGWTFDAQLPEEYTEWVN